MIAASSAFQVHYCSVFTVLNVLCQLSNLSLVESVSREPLQFSVAPFTGLKQAFTLQVSVLGFLCMQTAWHTVHSLFYLYTAAGSKGGTLIALSNRWYLVSTLLFIIKLVRNIAAELVNYLHEFPVICNDRVKTSVSQSLQLTVQDQLAHGFNLFPLILPC